MPGFLLGALCGTGVLIGALGGVLFVAIAISITCQRPASVRAPWARFFLDLFSRPSRQRFQLATPGLFRAEPQLSVPFPTTCAPGRVFAPRHEGKLLQGERLARSYRLLVR